MTQPTSLKPADFALSSVPQHIAIIMDGNGRWAEKHSLPRIEGHREGANTSEKIIDACLEFGVRYLTLYAFSAENWDRPDEEVADLMQLLKLYVSSKCPQMIEKGIKFTTIGEIDKLPKDVEQVIQTTKTATAHGKNLTLIMALSYGSKQEICRAVNKLTAQQTSQITPDMLGNALNTNSTPDPDLLIRTSGEYRISNFLLWELAYAEFYFTDKLWPDFSKAELKLALDTYAKRERRFGLTSAQLKRLAT